jgi:hypothetical protein
MYFRQKSFASDSALVLHANRKKHLAEEAVSNIRKPEKEVSEEGGVVCFCGEKMEAKKPGLDGLGCRKGAGGGGVIDQSCQT